MKTLRARFEFEGDFPDLGANYNIAPSHAVPIVRLDEGVRELGFVRWGLIPSWIKQIRPDPPFNARAETVMHKLSFRAAFLRRRCLVPTDGYYEWQENGSEIKQPYYVTMSDGGPFAMAGIWESWLGADGSEVETLAVITVEANPELRMLQPRMPAVLDPKDYDVWLDCRGTSPMEAMALLRPAPEGVLKAAAVSTRVNSVANDEPSLIEPV